MNIPLFPDLKNDRRWLKNLLRIAGFIILFFVLDFVISLFMLKGIERNYGLKSDSDVLLLGHSHLMLAVNKVMLEECSGLKVAKYTREGVNMADRLVMARQYFNSCGKKPATVILSIDPWLFTGEGLSHNSYLLFLPFMYDNEVDSYVRSSAKRFDYLRYKYIRSCRFNAGLLNASVRGWLKNWDNLKFGTVDTVRFGNQEVLREFRPVSFNRDLMDDLAGTLDFLHSEGTDVVLLNTPVWEPMIRANQEGYERSMFIIDSIAGIHCPEARIIDLVPDFSGRTELFFDPIHMNPQGQRAVTDVLGKYLVSGSN